MGLITLKEAAKILGVSYREATRVVNLPNCPKLPRTKGQTFRIPEEAFREWVKAGCQ